MQRKPRHSVTRSDPPHVSVGVQRCGTASLSILLLAHAFCFCHWSLPRTAVAAWFLLRVLLAGRASAACSCRLLDGKGWMFGTCHQKSQMLRVQRVSSKQCPLKCSASLSGSHNLVDITLQRRGDCLLQDGQCLCFAFTGCGPPRPRLPLPPAAASLVTLLCLGCVFRPTATVLPRQHQETTYQAQMMQCDRRNPPVRETEILTSTSHQTCSNSAGRDAWLRVFAALLYLAR